MAAILFRGRWVNMLFETEGKVFWTRFTFIAASGIPSLEFYLKLSSHDDVIKWKHFLRHCPFVRGIHRSPVDFPHKGQWRPALMFSLICAWANVWTNKRDAGDLRRYRAHYDVIVMLSRVITHTPTHALHAFSWSLRFDLRRVSCHDDSLIPHRIYLRTTPLTSLLKFGAKWAPTTPPKQPFFMFNKFD